MENLYLGDARMLSQELRSDTNFVVLASTKTYALPSYKPNKGDLCFSSTEKYLKVWNDTFLKAGTQGYKEKNIFFLGNQDEACMVCNTTSK